MKLRDLDQIPAGASGAIALAVAVSFLSGIFALKLLLRFVRGGRLHFFAPYCFALGVVGLCLT